jgi:hypothetical protein
MEAHEPAPQEGSDGEANPQIQGHVEAWELTLGLETCGGS